MCRIVDALRAYPWRRLALALIAANIIGCLTCRTVEALPGYVLTHASLHKTANGVSVHVRFSGGLAPYSVVNRSSSSFSVIFSRAMVRSSGIHVPRARGIVTSIRLRRGGSSVALDFSTSEPVTPRVVPGVSDLVIYLSPVMAMVPPNATVTAVPASSLSTTTQVVRLRHASLDEIAALFSPSPLHGGRSFQTTSILSQAPLSGGGYGGQSFGGTLLGGSLTLDMRNQLGSQRISDNVAIDRRLNAVIVTGTLEQVAPIVAEIKAVDRPDARQTSVQLDAKIFELTSSGARQVGINFAQNGPFATATLLSQTLQKPQLQATFQAQLFALIQQGKGTLISAPRLRTLSGTEASILTGDALPVVTTITYPGNPPTVQEQLQYVNVGVHLQVRPYVSSSGYVTSVVLAEVSNVTGFIQGNIPQISQRQAIATVRVRNGQPFVIGGLLQNNDITSIARVPLLSRIPIFGDLFKLESTTHEVTNLYVVITPHIITSASAP